MSIFRAVIFNLGLIAMILPKAAFGYEKPIFYLQFDIARAEVEILLNDIPVLHHDTPGLTSSEKPVPESVVNGENILRLIVSPLEDGENLFEEKSAVEASLIVRERNSSLDKYKTLVHINLKPTSDAGQSLSSSSVDAGEGPVKVVIFGPDKIVVERSVDIESPFPRWAWQDGSVIENNHENFESLLDEYRAIHLALSSGDKNQVKGLYEKAAKEFAAAYHYDDAEQGHRIINTGSLMNSEEWVLADISKLIASMGYDMKIYANGRMASLVDQDGRTPIVYLNTKVKMLNIQKFSFYKDKKNNWIMIR